MQLRSPRGRVHRTRRDADGEFGRSEMRAAITVDLPQRRWLTGLELGVLALCLVPRLPRASPSAVSDENQKKVARGRFATCGSASYSVRGTAVPKRLTHERQRPWRCVNNDTPNRPKLFVALIRCRRYCLSPSRLRWLSRRHSQCSCQRGVHQTRWYSLDRSRCAPRLIPVW
jgi:hypothetical protein